MLAWNSTFFFHLYLISTELFTTLIDKVENGSSCIERVKMLQSFKFSETLMEIKQMKLKYIGLIRQLRLSPVIAELIDQ